MTSGILSLQSLPQAAAAVVLAIVVLRTAARHQHLVVGVVLGTAVLEQCQIFTVDLALSPTMQVGPVTIHYLTDPVALCLGGVALVRWVRRPPRSLAALSAAALCLLGVAGIIAWWAHVETWIAVTVWREWIHAAAFAAWAVTSPTGWTRRTAQVFIGAAVVVATLQGLSLLVHGFRAYGDLEYLGSLIRDPRPLTASLALLMTVGVVLVWRTAERWTVGHLVLIAALLGSILVSQHRSVWLATIVCILVLLVHDWRGRSTRARAAVLTCLGTVAAVAVTQVLFASTQLSAAGSDQRTLFWRIDGWTSSLAVNRSTEEWLFGGVFGPTPILAPDPTTLPLLVSGSHSTYIAAIHVTGLVGLVALLIFLLSPLRRGARTMVDPTTIIAVTASLLVYGVFYRPPVWMFALVGLVCARPLVAGAWRAPADREATTAQARTPAQPSGPGPCARL